MHRVVSELDGVARLVSVGVRDLCVEEHEAIKGSQGRVVAFFDADLDRADFASCAKQIADSLPQQAVCGLSCARIRL